MRKLILPVKIILAAKEEIYDKVIVNHGYSNLP